jgi:hypothetical protein
MTAGWWWQLSGPRNRYICNVVFVSYFLHVRARICKPFKGAQESIPRLPGRVRQSYLSHRPDRAIHRLAESNPRNRFLVSNVFYKYGLWFTFKRAYWKRVALFGVVFVGLTLPSPSARTGEHLCGTQGEEIVRDRKNSRWYN